ncbi:MAG: hypothetical protein ACI4SS_06910 [Clostridia bacterium]
MKKNTNGAERLVAKMNDRAYAEAYDIPEDKILLDEDYIPDEEDFDRNKDVEIKGR